MVPLLQNLFGIYVFNVVLDFGKTNSSDNNIPAAAFAVRMSDMAAVSNEEKSCIPVNPVILLFQSPRQ